MSEELRSWQALWETRFMRMRFKNKLCFGFQNTKRGKCHIEMSQKYTEKESGKATSLSLHENVIRC